MAHSRRSILKRSAGLVAAGTATSLAGCSGAADLGSGEFDSGYAAFFTLNDWANRVAGDHAEFQDPVSVGQLGHGWEPDGNLAAEVASTDAFVYLDSPEFTWAQDLASTLEADYDHVTVIDALDGLEDDLLAWDGGHDHDEHDDDEHDEHDDEHDEHDDEHDDDEHDEHDDEHDDDDHDDDHDDHGQYDPHIWVDPVLATNVVDNIADELAEADPDNADDYAANAAAYADQLDEIHETFESLFERADRDVAVLAGHDSFQYLEARYGFRLHSPVGVSPQNEPTQSEIADTIDLVNEEGIDVILYDRFESPTLAETIVENSDATETMAITPAGGTIQEWNDAGYGYVEQMTEVNVPAFERAFGVQ